MRFCMVTTFYPPYNFGGDGIFVRNLSHQLALRGHEVHVIHCRDSYRALAGGEPIEPYADLPNVTVHGMESSAGSFSPLATQQTGHPLFKTRKIREILDQQFDVIHYHNISLVGGPKILEFGRALKLYTFHEYWLVCPTHLLFRFNRAPCAKRHCNLCTLAHGRLPQWWRATGVLDAAVGHVDTFLSPSRFGLETHRRFGLARPILHMPSFVPEASAPAPAALPDRPYFLYAGRLEHAKGPQTLVDFFRQWTGGRLVVAGAGSQERHLRRLAEGSNRIEFLGHISAEKLAALYRGAIALIVPSLTFEMFPLVCLEAFREGTPVVVRNRGALPEAVEDSGAGLIYDNDTQLASALERLASDTAFRDRLGRRGYESYRATWSPEAHLRRYFEIIENLSAGNPAPMPQPL